MDESTSIAEEVAAEIQMAAGDEIADLSQRKEMVRQIDELLRDGDIFRGLSENDDEITVSVITTANASRPAFAGLLYGAVGLRIDMTLADQTIVDVTEDARTTIETCDFGDGRRRIRWDERRLAIELASEGLESDPDLMLLDGALTITRQEMLTYTDSPAYTHWEQMLEELDAFWETQKSTIAPWIADGPVVCGLSRMRANLLFTALRLRPDEEHTDAGDALFVESVPTATREQLHAVWDDITDVGPNRLIEMILQGNERTVPYPYSESSLDRRWLPEQLEEFGVQGLFFRPESDVEPFHIELPGSAEAHSTAEINETISRLASLFWLDQADVPVPLWYARRECEFPSELLDLYYKKLNTQATEPSQ
jgi:hypothetical protein